MSSSAYCFIEGEIIFEEPITRPRSCNSHTEHMNLHFDQPCYFLIGSGLHDWLLPARPWRIVILKVAYYATNSARNFAKLCQNSQIMLFISEIMLSK